MLVYGHDFKIAECENNSKPQLNTFPFLFYFFIRTIPIQERKPWNDQKLRKACKKSKIVSNTIAGKICEGVQKFMTYQLSFNKTKEIIKMP